MLLPLVPLRPALAAVGSTIRRNGICAAALFLVLLAFPAFAFRGRPVADLRFDATMHCAPSGMATDGRDALLVCSNSELLASRRIYAQRISREGAVSPPLFVGMGLGADVTWTGSSYLVAIVAPVSDDGLYVARVSRDGALEMPATKIAAGSFLGARVVANGSRALLVAERGSSGGVFGYLLDTNGTPVAPEMTFASGMRTYDVAPIGSGFAVALFRFDTSVIRIDGDGARRGTTLVEGPYPQIGNVHRSMSGRLATDGTRLALLFRTSGPNEPIELRSAMIGADGTLLRGPLTVARDLYLLSLEWTGSEFLAAAGYEQTLGTLRLNGDGELLAPPVEIATGGEQRVPHVATTNGRELFAGFRSPQGASVVAVFRPDAPPLSTPLGRNSITPHRGVAIAAAGDQKLVAWSEQGNGALPLRVSRIDASGAYLDGEGIELAPNDVQAFSVASNGTEWLVVWSTPEAVFGARVTGDGAVLDRTPIRISTSGVPAVAWARDRFVVVTADGGLLSTAVMPDGAAGRSRRIIAAQSATQPYYHNDPALSFDGTRMVAVMRQTRLVCGGNPVPFCVPAASLVAVRLDDNGVALEEPGVLFADIDVDSDPAIASDGREHLVFGIRRRQVEAMIVDASVPLVATPRLVLAEADASAVTFDGSTFIGAWQRWDARIEIARITDAGIVDGPRTWALERGAFASSPAIAGDVVAYIDAHPGNEGVRRAAVAKLPDIGTSANVPVPPAGVTAMRMSGDRIRVRWSPVANAFGVAIELRLPDGAYRLVATASGTGTELTFALPEHVHGDAIRVRAWNGAGSSQPSSDAFVSSARTRAVGR